MGRHRLKRALATAIGGALLAPGALLGAGEVPEAPPAAVPEPPQQQPAPAAPGPAPPEPEQAPAPALTVEAETPAGDPDALRPARPRARDADVERADPNVRAAASTSVAIENFRYAPATVEVNAGDTVTWTNRDEEPHTATGNGGSFNTGNLARGESGSHTFAEPGRFPYICALHPSMRGTVVVASAAGSGPDSGSPAATPAGGESAPTAEPAGGDSGPGTLPATGAGVLIVALLGSALGGLGAALRRALHQGRA